MKYPLASYILKVEGVGAACGVALARVDLKYIISTKVLHDNEDSIVN
jgi:hypothetical protein